MSATRAFTIAALAGALSAMLPPPAAMAQAAESRAWTFCFTSAIGSCSQFWLSTQAALSPGGTRTGTVVDIFARHLGGAGLVSGLSAVTFYGAALGGVSDATPVTQQPLSAFGAPVIPAAEAGRWSAIGVTDPALPSDPQLNWFSLSSGFTPQDAQFIGGCLGGAFDATFTSSASTCGSQAYRFGFTSSVWLDASSVSRIAVDVYAGDGNGDFVPDLASCNAAVDGSPGAGIDLGDPNFTASCHVSPGPMITPEPATIALVATGLAAMAAIATRRRRAASDATHR